MPEPAAAELLGLPAEVLLFWLADAVSAVAEELRAPFGDAEFPGHHRTAELAAPLVPPAIHGPVPRAGHHVLAGEQGLDAFRGPVLEPIVKLLGRGHVRVEVRGVHRAQVARRVVIHDAARVEPGHDRLGQEGPLDVVGGPLAARALDAVDHVRVHVLVVPGRVVAHRVEDDGGVAPRHAHIEPGVVRVAVLLRGVGHLPVILGEMGLGEGHEHPHVVGRTEDLLEAQVRPRLAAVIVGVDEVDADPLQAEQALLGPGVAGRQRAHLGVVQRQGREEDPRAVEVEIPSVDPELAEAEADRKGGVEEALPVVGQRDGHFVDVLRRVEVPEPLGLPLVGQLEAPLAEVTRCKRPAAELADLAAVVGDRGAERVSHARRQAFQRRAQGDPTFAHGRIDLDVADAGLRRGADEVHVAAQTAPLDPATCPPGRVRIVEHQHDFLERPGDDQEADSVLAPGVADGREIHFARRELHLAYLLAIDEDHGAGTEVLHGEGDAAACPLAGNADFPLVPGRGDLAQPHAFPAWMRVDRLAIVLHVVADSRPAARDFEIAPAAGWHAIGLLGRLPLPEAVDGDSLARGRRFAVRFGQIPYRADPGGQRRLVRARRRPHPLAGSQQPDRANQTAPHACHRKTAHGIPFHTIRDRVDGLPAALHSPETRSPNAPSNSYLFCHVVYMIPMAPGVRSRASSQPLGFSSVSPS